MTGPLIIYSINSEPLLTSWQGPVIEFSVLYTSFDNTVGVYKHTIFSTVKLNSSPRSGVERVYSMNKDGDRSQGKQSSFIFGGKWPPPEIV